jgi:hypothetical protein
MPAMIAFPRKQRRWPGKTLRLVADSDTPAINECANPVFRLWIRKLARNYGYAVSSSNPIFMVFRPISKP